MFGKRELMILSNLRKNGREKLTDIARNTKTPVSTVFDKVKNYKENNVIKKSTCLIDFSKLGYEVDVCILLKVEKEEREKLKKFLNEKDCLNSIFKISNSYDFFVEGIFRDMQHLQDFLDELEDGFNLVRNDVLYVTSDVKREEFLNFKNN